MKDKTLQLMIMQHNMIGAPHWYVISHCSKIHRKFNEYKDAWEYAKSIAYVKNIETYD